VTCCEAIATGIWAIRGTDAGLGRYRGMLELRPGDNGSLQAIRLVELEDVLYTDGRAIDLVWTGTVASDLADSATLTVILTQADFITQVGDLIRTAADATPLVVMGPCAT
jgi:hypothetical protein